MNGLRTVRFRVPVLLGCLAAGLAAQESAAVFDAALVVSDAAAVPITHLLDLDGDGLMDAAGFETDVGSSLVNRKVALWRNDGSGRLQPVWSTVYPDSVFAERSVFAVGPLGAADGRDDFVLAYGTVVLVHFSAGSAAPASPVLLTESGAVRGLVVRDFNGDGRGDIGVLTDGSLRTWLHVSGSTFSPVSRVQAFSAGATLMAGEINGDAIPDLIVVDGAVPGYIMNFPVTGSQILAGAVLPQDVSWPMPTVGDIDGDGDQDIVVFGATSYRVHRRTGPASFNPEPPAAGGPATHLHDVDGDGDLDGACCSSGGGGPWSYPPLNTMNTVGSVFRVSLNQGGGAFAPAFPIPGLGAERLAGVADLDGDGDRDLVAGRAVYYARGPLTAPPHPAVLPSAVSERDLVDVEGDGDLDAQWGIGAFWQQNLGTGPLNPSLPPVLAPPPSGTTWAGPGYPGDWDGDGDPDLVVEWRAGQTFLSMRLLENRGGGLIDAGDAVLVPGIPFSQYLPLTPDACLPADADGDGDLDLVMRPVTGQAYWSHVWRNNGSGRFTWGLSFNSEFAVAFADFTGDGRPDALTSDGRLLLRPGIAGAGFGPPQVLLGGYVFPNPGLFDPWLDRVAIADFSSDGLPDVFAYGRAPSGPGNLYLLVSGGGTLSSVNSAQMAVVFAYPIEAVLLNMGVRLHALDANADGLTDLLAAPAAWATGGTTLFLKSGPAALAWAPARTQILAHGSVIVYADLDDDGDADALAQGLVRNRTFDLPASGSKHQFAAGFAGSGGLVPTLGVKGPFRPGLPAQIRIRGGFGAAAGILVLGDQQTATPMLGAIEYVNWVAWMGLALGGAPGVAGAGSWNLDIGPLPPSLAGQSVYMQAALDDPQGPMGLSRTNPVRITIGN